jgi:uracil phosphoribosyltransferase
MTILRDYRTERGDFIFYADRLSTLIVERALALVPTAAKTVRTPVGLDYEGVTQADEVSHTQRTVNKSNEGR